MSIVKNIVGKKFGRLTVIQLDKNRENDKGTYWLCKCDCGKTISVISYSLSKGNTRSCGCLHEEWCKNHFENLEGKKFGRYTAIRRVPRGNRMDWECRCDCGNIGIVPTTTLLSGKSLSCGCYQREVARNRILPNFGSGKNKLFGAYKNKSKKRGHVFEIEKDVFLKLVEGNCHYCGKSPSQELKSKKNSLPFLYNGIDRLDNSIGYVLGNCVSCCKTCNYAKRGMSVEEFREWIARVAKQLQL